MNEELDDRYIDWLYAMVGCQEENVDHFRLMKALFSREFLMLVPGDDNRCADGVNLRYDFLDSDKSVRPTRTWMNEGCSVLEMLIGIARHMSFEMDGGVGEWFWHLVKNLGLTRWHDKRWNGRIVDQILEKLVWRQYSYDGNGGLFPLNEPHEDQRYVELWFQMEAYMLEMS